MAVLILTNASSGATRNSGTNGDFTNLLRWALPQKSWAEEYGGGSGNAAVFRAASGNRRRIHVNHDSATSGSACLAVFRGCEDATSSTSLTDAFPTVAQVANGSCNALISNTASTTDRQFYLFVDEKWFLYLSNFNGTSAWDYVFFGDPPGAESGDTFATCIVQRSSSATSSSSAGTWQGRTPASAPSTNSPYWCRDISGATKSTTGVLNTIVGNFGIGGVQPARGGYANRVRREKIGLGCSGSTNNTQNSMAIDRRGWLPQVWNPLHSTIGTLNDGDTMTDSAYNASASFRAINTAGIGAWALLETTATWAPPGV